MSTNGKENVVVIERLTRRFGPKTALDQVSLAVPRGCVFGLVGANGAGKTTMLKHILGLYRAAEGSVRVFGKDLIPPRTLKLLVILWVLAAVVFFLFMLWLLPGDVIAWPYLVAAVILSVPFLRPAVGTLAFAWNRHR
ncbi:MAG: ATP-binding cassette domain-containing protein [Gemmataceae bacterium]|nr:ATP-binding cassette domain-containing protein [Gemmataceae bacterium]